MPARPSANHSDKRHGVRRPRLHNGYVEEWCPIRGRYVYQHRLMIEAQLGRFLEAHEIVHHRNHDKADNRLDNLQYHKSRSAHVATHAAEGTWGGKGKPKPRRHTATAAAT